MKKNPTLFTQDGVIFYGSDGSRTHDLCVANAALSQLSYEPEFDPFYHMLMWLRNQEGKGSVFSGNVGL